MNATELCWFATSIRAKGVGKAHVRLARMGEGSCNATRRARRLRCEQRCGHCGGDPNRNYCRCIPRDCAYVPAGQTRKRDVFPTGLLCSDPRTTPSRLISALPELLLENEPNSPPKKGNKQAVYGARDLRSQNWLIPTDDRSVEISSDDQEDG